MTVLARLPIMMTGSSGSRSPSPVDHRIVARDRLTGVTQVFEGVRSHDSSFGPLDQVMLARAREHVEATTRNVPSQWALEYEAVPARDGRLLTVESARSRAMAVDAEQSTGRLGEAKSLLDEARALAQQGDTGPRYEALLDDAEKALSESIGHATGWSGQFTFPPRNPLIDTAHASANQVKLWEWPVADRRAYTRQDALDEVAARLAAPTRPWD